MECRDAHNFVDGYLDHELDPARSLEVETHLRACTGCNQDYQDRQALRGALKADAIRFKAPAQLERRVLRAVQQSAKSESEPTRYSWSWIKFAAPLAAAALVLLTVLPFWGRRSQEELLTRDVVSSHIRSLMVDHLNDVASTDRHTVKPWFNGKLDFSPPVEDLAAAGFPLLGGRLDYLNDRAVAALTYQRDKHLINVFIWPTSEARSAKAGMTQQNGYNVLHWTDAGLNFWAVSDVEKQQLENFVELLKARPRAP